MFRVSGTPRKVLSIVRAHVPVPLRPFGQKVFRATPGLGFARVHGEGFVVAEGPVPPPLL